MNETWPTVSAKAGDSATWLIVGLLTFVLMATPVLSEPSPQIAPTAPGSAQDRAERLAQEASQAFDRFLLGESPNGTKVHPRPTTDLPVRDRSPRAIESASDWLARTQRNYDAVMERLSQPTVPNPVVDAARKFAAERELFLKGARSGETVTEITPEAPRAGPHDTVPDLERPADEGRSDTTDAPSTTVDSDGAGVLGWLNRGYRLFRDEVVGKLAAPSQREMPVPEPDIAQMPGAKPKMEPSAAGDGVAASYGAAAKTGLDSAPSSKAGDHAGATMPTSSRDRRIGILSPEEARRDEMIRKAEMERKATEAKIAEAARQAEAARTAQAKRRAEEERRAAEAARIAEAKAAEHARQMEVERKAQEQRIAEERLRAAEAARLAEALAAEVARRAEAARQAAEEQKAEEQRKAAEAAHIAQAKAAEDARKAETARKAQEQRIAEERLRAAEAARLAEALAAEEARRAEVTRKATEERKAEEQRKAAEAARIAEAKAAEAIRKAEEQRKAAEAARMAEARAVEAARQAEKLSKADATREVEAKEAARIARMKAADARRLADVKAAEDFRAAEGGQGPKVQKKAAHKTREANWKLRRQRTEGGRIEASLRPISRPAGHLAAPKPIQRPRFRD
ncbi:MAG: hypothetical protein AB7E81_12815 [Hyphomicrobiaceae bacterium]